METYKASLDTTSKILTGFVFLIAIFGVVISFMLIPWYGGLFVWVIPTILLLSTYAYRVVCYQITDEELIIKRPFSKFDYRISLSEIVSISVPDKTDFKFTIRTAGNGGMFGYSGYFMNNKLGSFRVYAPNRKNRILMVFKEKKDKIVISPDDSGMASDLQKRLKKGVLGDL